MLILALECMYDALNAQNQRRTLGLAENIHRDFAPTLPGLLCIWPTVHFLLVALGGSAKKVM